METLFRLPKVSERKRLTDAQMFMLDLVALHEGKPLSEAMLKHGVAARRLRNAITAKLVTCIAHGPGRYVLTPLGRAVRNRAHRYPGGESEPDRISA